MNESNFSCHLCGKNDFEKIEIIVTNCNHQFCLICLCEYLENNLNSEIKCPTGSCSNTISDSIIRKILDENSIAEYEKLCMNQIDNLHRCLLSQCGNYVEYEDKNFQYLCNNCNLFNCIKCGAAHFGLSCDEYQLNDENSGSIACQDELARAKNILDEKIAQSNRQSIVEAANKAILSNTKIFSCEICFKVIQKGSGVQLKNCLDLLCKDCLRKHVIHSTESPIRCPKLSCKLQLDDSECRQLLSEEEIQMYNDKNMRKAKSAIKCGYQCKSPNCGYFVDISDYNETTWSCTLCNSVNCLECREIHNGACCKGILSADELFIKREIDAKRMMKCPRCKSIIQKTDGCNWIKCSSCKTELCWILQTYRWGPRGSGDTSGGCRCSINRRCHPDCDGCIPHTN